MPHITYSIRLDLAYQSLHFFFEARFFGFGHCLVGPIHCSRDPQTSFFNKTFIKNGSHGTIHTFKIYFVIVFSVFNKNKLYPKIPIVG